MTMAVAGNRQKKPPAPEAVPLGVLIIGRKRPGFDQDWNAIMRRQAIGAMRELGFECIGGDEPVVDDETITAALQEIRAAGCKALVVLQPSLGNGQLALTVAQQWQGPVVLWATPERPEGDKASSCSLVAQHLWASIFRQVKHPFELVYGSPQDDATRNTLRVAIAVSRAALKVRHAKLGVVGSHAPGFIAMQADPFALRRLLGVQLHNLSLPQFIERARAISEADVKRDVDAVQALKLPMRGVTADDLPTNSRIYLALRELIAEESLDALALQCWPEIPNMLGQWPYLAMSRLADENMPISMEGDSDGALLCLVASEAGAGHGFITDWLEHDDETIHFWHAGSIPLGMADSPSLAAHFNIQKPLVVDGTLRVGQAVTIARLWRCDDRYFMTAFEGTTIPLRRRLTGNTGLVEMDGGNVRWWFDTLCHAGLPHHPVVFYGCHSESFRRLARMLDVTWIGKA